MSNDYINKLYDSLKTSQDGDIKIATISDLHLDYDYTEGMRADCDKPVCCRSDSGKPSGSMRAAGRWGDYNCDLNPLMLDSMF